MVRSSTYERCGRPPRSPTRSIVGFSKRQLILFLDRFWTTRGLVSGSCPLARQERLSPSRPMRLLELAEERVYSPERTAGFRDRLKGAEVSVAVRPPCY